jgi:multidrug efflux system membrane fusion protein
VLKANRGNQKLAVEAWDREMKNKLATGSLLAVDSQIDPTTGTIRFKAIFPNDDGMLFPNQFVNIRLLVDTRAGVILAPSAAIQHNTRGGFVYVVKPDKSVEIRTVTVGASEGTQTEVDDGLQPDEVVVTDGVDKLQNGSKVSLRTQDAAAKSK